MSGGPAAVRKEATGVDVWGKNKQSELKLNDAELEQRPVYPGPSLSQGLSLNQGLS